MDGLRMYMKAEQRGMGFILEWVRSWETSCRDSGTAAPDLLGLRWAAPFCVVGLCKAAGASGPVGAPRNRCPLPPASPAASLRSVYVHSPP